MKNNFGLIHIYTGNGKGKTTSAIGLSIRMCGNGFRVLFVQFLKSWHSGEIQVLNSLANIDVIRNNKPYPFTNKMSVTEEEEIKVIHNDIFLRSLKELEIGKYSMVVFDELLSAYNLGMIDKEMVINFLKKADNSIEIVITGRDAPDEITSLAHYVSDINEVKHPYNQGVVARLGIEN